MPELPEVETIRKGLEHSLAGKTLRHVELRRPDLRIPFPPMFREQLEGRTIAAIRRRAKYLLVDTCRPGECREPDAVMRRHDNDLTLIIHLGMSGRILLHEKPPAHPGKHDHVILTFTDGSAMVFNDARRFGLMTLCPTSELAAHPLFAHLGPEPFSKAFSTAYLYDALRTRSVAIKQAIMDAGVVVGVGNIYASEVLFRCRISPLRKANKVTKKELPALMRAIRSILREAIASGGSTLRDYVRSDGGLGYFQHRFQVYGRENKPCYVCGDAIKRKVQQGRSTYYCPACQR